MAGNCKHVSTIRLIYPNFVGCRHLIVYLAIKACSCSVTLACWYVDDALAFLFISNGKIVS